MQIKMKNSDTLFICETSFKWQNHITHWHVSVRYSRISIDTALLIDQECACTNSQAMLNYG